MKSLLIKNRQLMMITLFLSVTSLFAQKAEAPDHNFELGAKINDMTITEGGTVVVATNDGLVGIKPGQNELLFNFTDYGKVKPEELKYVPLSPYVVVGQTGFGGLQTKSAVIDYMSGKTLFSTEKNGWKGIGMSEVIIPQNMLIVSGQRKAAEKYAQAVALYDLDTGKEISMYKFKGSRQAMGKPLVLKDGVIIPTTKGLMKVDMTSGNVLWENELKYIGWMVASDDENDIYAFASTANKKNTKIYKIGSNGQSTWADERKVKGNVTNFQILPQGLAVVSDVTGGSGTFAAKSESKIALLNTANGEDLWEKAPKTKGYVQHFYIMDDGILFGIGSGGINKISFDGKPLFKKPLKTGENILTMAETPQGLIYITSEDANIVNLETGEQVWSKPLKFKRANVVSSTFDEKNNRYLIAADEKLFAIDASSGDSELLTESKFEGKEDPTSIEVRQNGILLTSDQNMMLLDWQGETNWHEYHRAPGKSAFGAILPGATALASTAVAMDAAARAGANRNYLGQYNQYGARMKRTSDAFAAIGSASFAEMAKRFKATAATQDAQFVLTKLDDGVGLVKLNKDTGDIEKEIILKDKKPVYKVDEFGGYLYYKPNDKTIYAYNLNQ